MELRGFCDCLDLGSEGEGVGMVDVEDFGLGDQMDNYRGYLLSWGFERSEFRV